MLDPKPIEETTVEVLQTRISRQEKSHSPINRKRTVPTSLWKKVEKSSNVTISIFVTSFLNLTTCELDQIKVIYYDHDQYSLTTLNKLGFAKKN